MNSEEIKRALFHPVPEDMKPFVELWREQVSINWTVDTLGAELSIDKDVYPTLQPNLKEVIFRLAVYFSVVDFFAQKVASVLSENRVDELHISILFAYVGHIEGVHSDMYSRFLDMIFVDDRDRVSTVIDEILKSQSSLDIFNWGKTYAESTPNDMRPLIIGMICYEGLMLRPFFSVPCAIKSVKNILPAFLKGNEMVGRDEFYHMLNYIAYYNYYCKKTELGPLSDRRVVSQISGAIDLTDAKFDDLIVEDIPSWNIIRAEMKDFSRLTANFILQRLNIDYKFETKIKEEPDYMKSLGAFQITSFHAIAPSEYSMPSSENVNMADMY